MYGITIRPGTTCVVPGFANVVSPNEVDILPRMAWELPCTIAVHAPPSNPDDCACTPGTVCRQNSACPRLRRNSVEH